MLWDISVSRIQTATRNIRVEADTLAEAETKALEQASDEDFGGCVTEYAFETNGGSEVGDENARRRYQRAPARGHRYGRGDGRRSQPDFRGKALP